jgi:N-acetyl sugar amidotransferase
MDTSDPKIKFNDLGECNHCTKYFSMLPSVVKTGNDGSCHLIKLSRTIKDEAMTRKSPYDCVIGLSGGVDSTYTAMIVKETMGLNPLAVSLDNGWNTDIANYNIENTIRLLNIRLDTHVINWEEMKSLELAYLRASVLNLEAISDHAIIALLWLTAARHNISYILTGHNHMTEAILPYSWRYQSSDLSNILDIHEKKGNGTPLKTFPMLPAWKLAYLRDVRHIKVDYPLNYLPEGYNKAAAKATITTQLAWHDYGSKHGESVITRFYQGYILPTKWGIDKRKAHLSTLICSGQMTRGEAITEVLKPPYSHTDNPAFESDWAAVTTKLGLTGGELHALLNQPNRSHEDYKTDTSILKTIERARKVKMAAGKRIRKLKAKTMAMANKQQGQVK